MTWKNIDLWQFSLLENYIKIKKEEKEMLNFDRDIKKVTDIVDLLRISKLYAKS